MGAITTNLLKLIIADQREEEVYPANCYHRTMESKVKELLKSKEITVLTGLRRFYHRDKKECDFVIQEGVDIIMAIQVTQDISNPETKQREFNGVLEAMQIYSLNEGYILTESSEFDEVVNKNGAELIIHVCPVWKWLVSLYR